jgi:hypothetical protein
MPSNNSFLTLVESARGGTLLDKFQEGLDEVSRAVLARGKKGVMTITIAVTPDSDNVLDFSIDTKLRLPTPPPIRVMAFASPRTGKISLTDPGDTPDLFNEAKTQTQTLKAV